jgi:hypothetical protein
MVYQYTHRTTEQQNKRKQTFHLFPNSSLSLIPGDKRRELIEDVFYALQLE